MAKALMPGVVTNSLTSTTTGTGTALAVPANCKYLTVIVEGTGTISGGVLSIEEASNPDYTGTWSVVTTTTTAAVTGTASQSVHVTGLFKAVRTRLTSNVTGGGTISTLIMCGAD